MDSWKWHQNWIYFREDIYLIFIELYMRLKIINKIRQKLNINYDHLQMATEWKNPVVIWSTSLVEMVWISYGFLISLGWSVPSWLYILNPHPYTYLFLLFHANPCLYPIDTLSTLSNIFTILDYVCPSLSNVVLPNVYS